jgi:hypothetical protein
MVPIEIDFDQRDTPKPLQNTSSIGNKRKPPIYRSRQTQKETPKLATAKDLSSFFLVDLQMKELSALATKELKTFQQNAEELSTYFYSKLERKQPNSDNHSSGNTALEKAKHVSDSHALKSAVSRKRSLAETQNSSLSYSHHTISDLTCIREEARNQEMKFIDPSFHFIKEAKMTDTDSTHVRNEYQREICAQDAKLSDGHLVSSLISDSHRELITPFEYFVLCQVALSSFEEADIRGNRSCVPPNFTGLACSHCNGMCKNKTGRYFPTALKTISDPKKMLLPLYRHLKSCKQCPIETKEKLAQEFEKYRNAKSNLPHGSRTSFYRLLWHRMHPDSASISIKKKRGKDKKFLQHVSL